MARLTRLRRQPGVTSATVDAPALSIVITKILASGVLREPDIFLTFVSEAPSEQLSAV